MSQNFCLPLVEWEYITEHVGICDCSRAPDWEGVTQKTVELSVTRHQLLLCPSKSLSPTVQRSQWVVFQDCCDP